MSDIMDYQTDLSNYQNTLSQYQNVVAKLNEKQDRIRDTVDAVAPIALDYLARRGPGYVGGAVGKLFGKSAGDKAEAFANRVVSNEGGLVEGLKAEATNAIAENVPANLQPLATSALAGDVSGMQSAATNLASTAISENVPANLQPLAQSVLSGDTAAMQASATSLVQPIANQATAAATDLAGQATSAVEGLAGQATSAVGQATSAVEGLTGQATSAVSGLSGQFRIGRVMSSLQDNATSGWGSDSTLARVLTSDRLPANIRARIGQGEQIGRDLFGQNNQPVASTPEAIPEEIQQPRPATTYNEPEEFVSPKQAPGTSTQMTDMAGDLSENVPEASDFATASSTAGTDVPTVVGGLAEGLSAGAEVGADIGTTVLSTLGGLTEGLLDSPLAPLALFTGLGAVLDKVFDTNHAPVFQPSHAEFQSGF